MRALFCAISFWYNKYFITNNIFVNNALVYFSAIAFFMAIFPVHVFNYVYASTAEKYAGINITVYRLFTVLNLNTAQNPLRKDKDDKSDTKIVTPSNWLTLFNNLCITKIVQLGDYGLQNPDNAYVALANNAVTNAVYTFVELNGGKTKLKNYAVLNFEHGQVNYYLKLAGVINVITLLKLFTVFYWGKINET